MHVSVHTFACVQRAKVVETSLRVYACVYMCVCVCVCVRCRGGVRDM